MKIFNPENTTHPLNVIPRYYVDNAIMTVRYELQNETTTHELVCSEVNGYLSTTFDLEMTEGQSFELEIKDVGGTVIYRGKGYASTKPKQQ